MTKNQKGFTVIESLLLVMTLFLLIGAGYFVWHKQQAQTAQSNTKATKKDLSLHPKPTYSGTNVKFNLHSLDSPNAFVEFRVPDGWIADKSSSSGNFFADDLTYTPGTKFTISETANGKDIDRFMLSVTDTDSIPKEYKVYKKSDYGKVNGNKTTLYYYKFPKGENIGNVQMQGGETEHMYFITKGSDAVMVSYYALAGDKDQQSLVDQVIQSIKF